jgi:hypothetical protein
MMATTVFIAEKEEARFWIAGEPTDGWAFIVDKNAKGEWQPFFDTWERWFFEVMRYLPEYGAGDLVWRCERTGETVDLMEHQAEADDVRAQPTDTPDALVLD